MEKIDLDAKSVAYSQGMIFDGQAMRPLPLPQFGSEPLDIITEPDVLPVIEFGMQKAGTLSISDRFEVPARLAPSADTAGLGASATHPHTEAETLDGLNASRAIAAAYSRAVAQQVEGKGMFCRPFFVRYAWRYADGSHSRPSAPQLMLPAVLPPCLAVLGNEAVGEQRVISFSPSSCRYFSLRGRVLDAGAVAGSIVALDVFITVPVSTHQADAALPRGVMRWASASAFVGNWAENGDDYADRTAQDVGLATARAWHFPPNPTLESELLQSVDFYRIASLSVQEVKAGAGYFDVPVSVATDPASVKASERLDCGPDGLSPLEASLDPVPKARLRIDGRLYAACSQMDLPAPQPMASTEATVWAKRDRQVRRVSKSFATGLPAALDGAFPRYLYYPCPGAYRMRLKQGSRTWTLPLKPTADGRGAYWWGGLGAEPSAPPSTTMPMVPADNGLEAGFDVGCVVAISVRGNERVWQTLRHCGEGSPVGLVSAPGQVAVLTDSGVWRVSANADSRLLVDDDCLPYLPCSMPGGVAYAADRGIVILSGSSARLIPEVAEAPSLPGLSLLSPAAAPQLGAAPVGPSVFRRLHFDGQLLYVRDAVGRMMAYLPSSQGVGIPSASGLVVTRPFATSGRRLVSVAVSGHFSASAVSMLLWGSHDGQAWTLVATSCKPLILPVCGTPYRWYAVAIASPTLPSALLSLELGVL